MAISRRWHSETYPRIWASFRKQCHSPLDLRQYSLSVSDFGRSFHLIRIQALTGYGQERDKVIAGKELPWSPLYSPTSRASLGCADRVDSGDILIWFEVQSSPWTAVLWSNLRTGLQGQASSKEMCIHSGLQQPYSLAKRGSPPTGFN
jgi:hypothetical protein